MTYIKSHVLGEGYILVQTLICIDNHILKHFQTKANVLSNKFA